MFSERLKSARNSKNVTQKTVADFLGINLEAYQHYEYNIRKPKFDTLIKLADYFNVSLDWLTGRSDER